MKRYPETVRFRPINPRKYVGNINDIIMRSSWESKLACFLDSNENVLKWGSEIKAIPYFSSFERRVRRYFPDFWAIMKLKDGSEKKYIIEIKPYSETIAPKPRKKIRNYQEELITWQRNQDKWKAAREFAEKNNFEFKIMTEYELGIKKRNNKI